MHPWIPQRVAQQGQFRSLRVGKIREAIVSSSLSSSNFQRKTEDDNDDEEETEALSSTQLHPRASIGATDDCQSSASQPCCVTHASSPGRL